MASLAILVSFILLVVVLSGPLCLLLSSLSIVPNFIVYLLGILTILIGFWFFFIPIAGIRYIGLITAGLGWLAINKRRALQKH